MAKFLENGSLQRDHQYYYQVQTQMFVCDVAFADFVVCTFPNDTATINIEWICVDEDFLVESIVQAGQFYTVLTLPELLGKWYTRVTLCHLQLLMILALWNIIIGIVKWSSEAPWSAVKMMNVHKDSGFTWLVLNWSQRHIVRSGTVLTVASYKLNTS